MELHMLICMNIQLHSQREYVKGYDQENYKVFKFLRTLLVSPAQIGPVT